MLGAWTVATALRVLAQVATPVAGATTLEPHLEVLGADVAEAEFRPSAGGAWRSVLWDVLDSRDLAPGTYEVRAMLDAGSAAALSVQIPPCAGRRRVTIDGAPVQAPPGPLVVALAPGRHELALVVEVSPYERRIACGERPRVGAAVRTVQGLGLLRFASPHGAHGGGSAVVYVPPAHDVRRAAAVLLGAHPWNGSIWTYAAYADLLFEARARDVVLLMPSGLGNSLYTAEAEDEVMRALDALAAVVAVDQRRVSIWGASMGGAGATTIGFHHPDRFATVTSFFGDSKYDRSTYVRALLPDEGAAHRVNALDIVDNARHVPVWLIHGESDVTSPIRQSELLARALEARGFSIRFDHIAGVGHSGALVGRYSAAVVDFAASARVPQSVPRVTYRSVRAEDVGAYGLRLERDSASPAPQAGGQVADAFVDIERRDDGVHVLRAEGVRGVELERGALGTDAEHPPGIVVDGTPTVSARWAAGHTP
jgi:pimeloyl-ACP methyl ester carboxylesterase